MEASIALLAEEGLAGLTGAALAESSGVSKATVFHHFPSIDEVPLAVLDHIVDGLTASVQHHDTPRGYLLAAGRDVLRLTADRANEALAMNALLTSASQNAKLADRMSSLLVAGRESMAEQLMRLTSSTDPGRARIVADIASTAVDGMATHLILTGEYERLARAWEQLVDALLAMLGDEATR